MVLLGDNESGKSTFFSFLNCLLYGFHPATRKLHPYAPSDDEEPFGGSARIALDDGGGSWTVRRLLSATGAPKGVAEGPDAAPAELRNRPLSWASHVPRRVYRQVYALTLQEMARLEGEEWMEVQDRLVQGMGAVDLRSPRKVERELRSEADALARTDRRGKPKARELERRLGELRQRRELAKERDAGARAKAQKLAETLERADAISADIQAAQGRLEALEDRIRRLLPIRRAILRVEALDEEAGDLGPFQDLGPDPLRELERLEARLARGEAQMGGFRERADELERVRSAFEERHLKLAELEQEARRVAATAASIDRQRVELGEEESHLDGVERRLDETGARILEGPWRRIEPGALGGGAVKRILDAFERYGERRKARTAAEKVLANLEVPPEDRPDGTWLLVGISILAGVVLAWILELTQGLSELASLALLIGAGLAGAGVLGAGLVSFAKARARMARVGERREEQLERVGALADEESGARRLLEQTASRLPIKEEILRAPRESLASDLRVLAEQFKDRESRKTCAQLRRDRIAKAELQLDSLRDTLRRALGKAPPEDPERLIKRLEEALEAREKAKVASVELEGLNARVDELEEGMADIGQRAGAIRESLAEVADGDVLEGARRLEARRQAKADADRIREELAGDEADLPAARAEIAAAGKDGIGWDDLDGERERARDELRARRRSREDARVEATELSGELSRLQSDESLWRVDGKIEATKEELHRVRRARDRAYLLAEAVRLAGERFRSRMHPRLLRRAGAMLAGLTQRRYDAFEYLDGVLAVRRSATGARIRIGGIRPRLSRGTREQLYLALRLAAVEQLDLGKERLPLCLDEVMVNWSQGRRDAGLELLEEASQTRQIFFTTCHPALAAELEDRGARIVELPAPSQASP